MTKDELRTELAALGLTQGGLAGYVGANARTVRRWATGEHDIPPWVPVLFRLLHALPAPKLAEELGRTRVN